MNNLGSADNSLSKYEKAISYYQQALPLFQQVKNLSGEGKLLNNIGNLLEKQKQPELAIVFYKQSVSVREIIRVGLRKLTRDSSPTPNPSPYRTLAHPQYWAPSS